jgi:hypothetical protein
MVYTIKKLEFKKLEWRLGCKTCIVYTGLKAQLTYKSEKVMGENNMFKT